MDIQLSSTRPARHRHRVEPIVAELRDLRLELNTKQQVLAEYLGVSRQCFSSWENGRVPPPLPVLRRWSKFFGKEVVLR